MVGRSAGGGVYGRSADPGRVRWRRRHIAESSARTRAHSHSHTDTKPDAHTNSDANAHAGTDSHSDAEWRDDGHYYVGRRLTENADGPAGYPCHLREQ